MPCACLALVGEVSEPGAAERPAGSGGSQQRGQEGGPSSKLAGSPDDQAPSREHEVQVLAGLFATFLVVPESLLGQTQLPLTGRATPAPAQPAAPPALHQSVLTASTWLP